MKLTNKILKMVASSNSVKGKLADAFGKHINTINRWVKVNDIMLTHSIALKVYKDEFNVSPEEAIQK